VSAHIKRLQILLGGDLFDRSTQGISLTEYGELVVSYARRMLSINDQIVHFGGAGSASAGRMCVSLCAPTSSIR
jgi:DNA-binding transcriptional LysR family regulator